MCCFFIFLFYHLRYALLQKCWEADVDHRICFKEIVTELSDDDIIVGGLSDSTNDNYIHF